MGMIRILIYATIALAIFHNLYGFPDLQYVFKVKFVKNTAQEFSDNFSISLVQTLNRNIHYFMWLLMSSLKGSQFSPQKLRRAFSHEYPNHVLEESSVPCIAAYTGGLQGSVCLLYVSFTELLVLYHAEMDTSGNTGRHYMNVSTTVLRGSLTESSGNIAPHNKYKRGENRVFRMGESAHVQMEAGTTLLIYGRGFVPLTMGYWVSDSLFSHHDLTLVLYTVWYFIKGAVLSNVWFGQWLQDAFTYLWQVSYSGATHAYDMAYHTFTHLPDIFQSFSQWLVSVLARGWDYLSSLLL